MNMQVNRQFQRWIFASTTPLFILLVGCSSEDFGNVQSFASGAATVNDGFQLVATDFYDSCVRSARYTVLGLPSRDNVSTPVFGQREKAAQDCSAEKELQPRLINANAILVNYMIGLGNLAGDRPVNFGPNIRKLGDSISSISQFDPGDVKAATSIVDLLFKMWSDSYRRAKLKDVIVNTDPSVQVYISGLKKIVDRGYIDSHLITEQSALDKYFQNYLSAQYPPTTSTKNSPPTGTKDLMIPVVDEAWRTRQEAIDKRIAVARAYSAVLSEVASTHADLKRVFGGGTAVAAEPCMEGCEKDKQALAEANRVLQFHAQALEPLVQDLKQALLLVKQSS
jgi:hypothetical protein